MSLDVVFHARRDWKHDCEAHHLTNLDCPDQWLLLLWQLVRLLSANDSYLASSWPILAPGVHDTPRDRYLISWLIDVNQAFFRFLHELQLWCNHGSLDHLALLADH